MKTTLLMMSVIVLAACATTEQSVQTTTVTAKPAVVLLADATMPPTPEIGTEYHWIANGEPAVTKVIALEDGKITSRLPDGCQLTAAVWQFGPMLEWKDCNGQSGYQTVKKSEGSPWPMQVGNSWSHNYYGVTSNGLPFKGKYRCNVKSIEEVAIPAGEFNAFKIVCKDGQFTSTYWYTPDHLARGVLHTLKGPSGQSRSELVHVAKVQ